LNFKKAVELRNWNAKKRLKDEILTRESTAQDDTWGEFRGGQVLILEL